MDRLSLFKVHMNEKVTEKLSDVLHSGFITQGPKVEEFEQQLRDLFDYPYILTLNSATSGLTLACRMAKDNFVDDVIEVLCTPLTCMATNIPVVSCGMKIKWVDVDPSTGLMSLDDLQRKLNERTKIVCFVHWGGYPMDLDHLDKILDDHQVKYGFRPYVIEDCAHAFLSEYKGKKIGTHGNFAVFSLQAIKHLTTGDGGLLFCPDSTFYEKAKLLRWYGIDRDKRNFKRTDFRLESDVTEWGYKFHMNDINATIGLSNLPDIPRLIAINRRNARYYGEALSSFEGIGLMSDVNNVMLSSYWLYSITVPHKQEFIEFMDRHGVMVSQVHQRNDVHTCFKEFKTKLPNLDELEKKMVCIPCGWWLTVDDLSRVVRLIGEFLEQHNV